MILNVKVTGKIEDIKERPMGVIIKGKLDRLVMSSECCDTEIIRLLKGYDTVILKGNDLNVTAQIENVVIVTGEFTALTLYNSETEESKDYYVKTCCIKLVKAEEIEEDDLAFE